GAGATWLRPPTGMITSSWLPLAYPKTASKVVPPGRRTHVANSPDSGGTGFGGGGSGVGGLGGGSGSGSGGSGGIGGPAALFGPGVLVPGRGPPLGPDAPEGRLGAGRSRPAPARR